MNKWTRVGIIILVIGVSLLAGTIYRSNTTDTFGTSSVFGLAPNAWSLDWRNETTGSYYLWAPREFRMEVRVTTKIDVYILNSDEINLWKEDGTVKPAWAFEETGQNIYTLQITGRGRYIILVYNPTNESVPYKLDVTLYGIEKDLLSISITFTFAGLAITTISVIRSRKKQASLPSKLFASQTT
jgi:hypothetical protein